MHTTKYNYCSVCWSRSSARGGFTIIELVIALSVFTIAAAGVLSTIITSSNLNRFNAELNIATEAAESVLEQMRAVDFSDIFASFNADASDDPVGAVAAGNTFTVDDLGVQATDADGFAGIIEFPTRAGVLREDGVDEDFGTPRDLNLDGLVDAGDRSGDYQLLPVRVRVEWSGVAGDQNVELLMIFSDN